MQKYAQSRYIHGCENLPTLCISCQSQSQLSTSKLYGLLDERRTMSANFLHMKRMIRYLIHMPYIRSVILHSPLAMKTLPHNILWPLPITAKLTKNLEITFHCLLVSDGCTKVSSIQITGLTFKFRQSVSDNILPTLEMIRVQCLDAFTGHFLLEFCISPAT